MSKGKVKKVMINIIICVSSLLILAITAILIISGAFVSPKYLEPWQSTYSEKFDDPRVRIAAHGLLASNGHNMQPWKIKLDKNDTMAFYLYADSERVTNEVDPLARQMLITQGTFLEYASIAGNKSGYQTSIDLFPEGVYNELKLMDSINNKPVAKMTLTKSIPQNNPLYDYIFLPDTNRSAYQPAILTNEQISQLENINSYPDISIKIFQDKENVDKLGSLVMQGAVIEAGVNRVMDESSDIFRANEYQKNKYRYGFSVDGQGTSGVMKHVVQGLVTLFPSMNTGKAAADMFIQSTRASVENTSVYVLIITNDNSRLSQVQSGMLYSRLVLTAHSLGCVMQPLSQILEEYPEMNKLYRSIHHDYAPEGGTIQMLIRLGKQSKDVPQSMRRDVMDLIIGK